MKLCTLNEIYTPEMIDSQKERYAKAMARFEEIFKAKPTRFFSASGRSEVGGNHTDHNCGCVLACGVSLDVIAMVVPTDDNMITVKSEGFPIDEIDFTDTEIYEEQKNTSASLIRGVVAGFNNKGRKVGGFKAYTISNVLKGSGLSSSAAFEVLIGTILNGLYNSYEISDVEIAQTAQYAENVYFGKPSGLMDQMASSVGGFITIDFKDTENPIIEAIDFDFAHSGYSLCIVDTKGSHANLTPEYAAIPAEMKSVAKFFGKDYLREITRDNVIANINELRKQCSDRACLRALHFFDDNQRVRREADALKSGDFQGFLDCINESGLSSYCYLQNIYANSQPQEQGMSIGLYIAKNCLDGEGACRVHGGGFAGTIQAFVPQAKLEKFVSQTESVFGEGSCHVLSIRPVGGAEVKL